MDLRGQHQEWGTPVKGLLLQTISCETLLHCGNWCVVRLNLNGVSEFLLGQGVQLQSWMLVISRQAAAGPS